MFVLK